LKLLPAAAGCAALLLVATGCGQQNRGALARQQVETYWRDIDHMKLNQAYSLITPGVQAQDTRKTYEQNIVDFLKGTGGISVKTGKAKISDGQASVPVAMYSPKSGKPLKACQHLVWMNNTWLISDAHGALSPANSCTGSA
jgi:hypothetical protein